MLEKECLKKQSKLLYAVRGLREKSRARKWSMAVWQWVIGREVTGLSMKMIASLTCD